MAESAMRVFQSSRTAAGGGAGGVKHMETGVRGEFIMKSRKILVLTALLIGQFFALNANAQNLYISNIDVRARRQCVGKFLAY